jgi:dTDP-glucose 4,6-dehydratase
MEKDIQELLKNEKENFIPLNGKTFLVTGSTGMIGHYLVSFLMALSFSEGNEGIKVIAHARNREKANNLFNGYLTNPRFKLVIDDISSLLNIEDNIDYIVHAASPTQPDDFLAAPVDIINLNVFDTKTLLQLALIKQSMFCFLSTLEVYGEIHANSYPVIADETMYGALDTTNLRSVYPESNRMAEMLCVAYEKQYGIRTAVARITPTFSSEIDRHDKRVFADFLLKAIDGDKLVLKSDGANKRTYTYVTDTIAAILYILLSATSEIFVFNVSNMNNVITIRELAGLILEESGREKSDLHIEAGFDSSNWSRSTGLILTDSKRLESLGWQPRIGIREGIRRAINNMKVVQFD